MLRRELGVIGKFEIHIGTHELRVLEDRDLEIARLLAAVFEMVGEIVRHLGHAPAKHRIGEALHERDGARRGTILTNHEADVRRQRAAETRQHHETVTALNTRVPRRDGDAVTSDPLRRFTVDARDPQTGERKNKTSQCEQMDRLPNHETRTRHHAPPVLFLTVRGRLLNHAVLKIPGFLLRIPLLLNGGEQHTVQLGMLRLDLARNPARVRSLREADKHEHHRAA